MGIVQKINFPYFLKQQINDVPVSERIVVFFGANFLGDALPRGWDGGLFIKRNNQILSYIRKHFPGRCLVYQPHPNETTEYKLFDLRDFVVGEKTVAELFLYDKAGLIEYVFSACSGASISAFAMGFNAAIFLDTLQGIITEWDILGYKSYFAGLPESFFIKSFDQPVFTRPPILKETDQTLFLRIHQSLGDAKTVWLVVPDPSIVVKAMILAQQLGKISPGLKMFLIKMNSRRWSIVHRGDYIFDVFDRVVDLSQQRVRYSVRPHQVMAAVRAASAFKKLPIIPGDAIISFATMLFGENCILSYFPMTKKIALIENRWYDFTYGGGSKEFQEANFSTSWGVRFFNYILEPLLGLYRTLFLEYEGCNVINRFRYIETLEKIYDMTFVLMP